MPHRGTCHHYDTRRNGREPRTGILQAAARRIGLAAAWLLAVSAATEEATFRPDIFSAELTGRTSIDLNGAWRFLRDPDNTGADQGWQHGKAESEGTMTVPGAPQAQGYGDAHPHQRTHFAEPFWIWRTFEVPQFAAREHVWFRLGGVLPAAELYINGTRAGYTRSSRTPQRIDITALVAPGENLAAIKVCDPPEVRLDGLLEWNEGNTHWTGPYRPIHVEIADESMVIDAYLRPRLAEDTVEYTLDLARAPDAPMRAELAVTHGDTTIHRAEVPIDAGSNLVTGRLKLDEYTTWTPAHPVLYAFEVTLLDAGSGVVRDRCALRFGMREITTQGTKLCLNGRPIFWNVFGDDLYFPETLCPPADKNWYLPRLQRARAYGFNGVKGCVDTMPPEYIEAADEAGILIIQEMPFGLSTLRANRYTIDDSFIPFYAAELDGLVRTSRNHASVVAYSMSSEMEFTNQTQRSFDFFSRELPAQTRALAPHALVIDCTGYLNTVDTDKGERVTDFYASIHPQWMKEVLEEADMITDNKRPLILHEYNWWSCYPDLGDRARYDGAKALPYWLDNIEETAAKNGQTHLLPLYRERSLWLQTIARKDGIEYARRNPGVEGYILWLLIDFGHWSEGLLNDFWEPKNVSPAEFLQSNGETVILLAKEGDRALAMGREQRIPLGISHYGEADYPGARLDWLVRAEGHDLDRGSVSVPHLEPGAMTSAGDIVFLPPDRDGACKIDLDVTLTAADGAVVNTNAWSFWAFPGALEPASEPLDTASLARQLAGDVFVRLGNDSARDIPSETSLIVTDRVDGALAAYIEGGGRCLLFSRAAAIENRTPYYGTSTFYGIYRSIPWNAGSAGNMGTIIADHPAMTGIPHDGFCDLYWVRMLRGFYPMEYEPLRPHGVEPIIRNIDSHRANRNNAFLIEFNVGEGRVIATTIGVLPNLKDHIEARYLYQRLADYARGDAFRPTATVPKDDFVRLFSQKTETELPRSAVDPEGK